MRGVRRAAGAAVLWTVAVVATWWATGGDAYTKFTVVERVEQETPEGDLLGDAGLYDDAPRVETVRRDEFRLGLLPTPSGLIDRHWLSVATLVGCAWVVAGVVAWRRHRAHAAAAKEDQA